MPSEREDPKASSVLSMSKVHCRDHASASCCSTRYQHTTKKKNRFLLTRISIGTEGLSSGLECPQSSSCSHLQCSLVRSPPWILREQQSPESNCLGRLLPERNPHSRTQEQADIHTSFRESPLEIPGAFWQPSKVDWASVSGPSVTVSWVLSEKMATS